jgi:hypothetical protein
MARPQVSKKRTSAITAWFYAAVRLPGSLLPMRQSVVAESPSTISMDDHLK